MEKVRGLPQHITSFGETEAQLPTIQRTINTLRYPSGDRLVTQLEGLTGSGVLLGIGIAEGLPKKLGAAGIAGVLGLTYARMRISESSFTSISKHFKIFKTSSQQFREFSGGTVLKRGEPFMEIHMCGVDENKEWLELSDYERGKKFTEEGILGLWDLAARCRMDYPEMRGIKAFHGMSDIIHPGFFEDMLHIHVSPVRNRNKIKRFETAINNNGKIVDSKSGRIRKIAPLYEFWLSRNELVANEDHFGSLLANHIDLTYEDAIELDKNDIGFELIDVER